jgi:phage terminase small subunit
MTEIDGSAPARRLGQLKNPRWEQFAHEIARGSTADAAYQAAGYAQSRGNASRLRAVEVVDKRIVALKEIIQELQKRSSHRVALTQSWVLEQLIGIVLEARAKTDFTGANKALNLIGLHLGMFVEKKEIGGPGAFDGLTIAAKRERMMDLARTLGLGPVSPDGRWRFGDGITPLPLAAPGDIEQ